MHWMVVNARNSQLVKVRRKSVFVMLRNKWDICITPFFLKFRDYQRKGERKVIRARGRELTAAVVAQPRLAEGRARQPSSMERRGWLLRDGETVFLTSVSSADQPSSSDWSTLITIWAVQIGLSRL